MHLTTFLELYVPFYLTLMFLDCAIGHRSCIEALVA
jgi:hypothetical protein